MNTFEVVIEATVLLTVEVDADNRTDAKQKAFVNITENYDVKDFETRSISITNDYQKEAVENVRSRKHSTVFIEKSAGKG